MLDLPIVDYLKPESQLAGEKYSANLQCKLVFGNDSTVCSYMVGIILLFKKYFTVIFHVNACVASVQTVMVWQ